MKTKLLDFITLALSMIAVGVLLTGLTINYMLVLEIKRDLIRAVEWLSDKDKEQGETFQDFLDANRNLNRP